MKTKKFRKQFGLTQAELARLLRVDRVTVARWETGKHECPLPTRNLLSKAAKHCSYGVAVAAQMAREGEDGWLLLLHISTGRASVNIDWTANKGAQLPSRQSPQQKVEELPPRKERCNGRC